MLLALLALACRCAPPEGGPRGHYAAMAEVHAALVAGDLEGVRERSRALDGGAIAERAAADPALAEHLDRLHGAVGFAIAATDLEDAATAAAVMGRACGGCHVAAGHPLAAAAPPASGDPARDHAAGAEAAWLGYIAGDRPIVDAGLALYAGAGIDPAGGAAARAMAAAGAPEARAAAAARWLLGCAGCHARSPGPPGHLQSTPDPAHSEGGVFSADRLRAAF